MADVVQFQSKALLLEQVWDADKVWAGEQTAPTYRTIACGASHLSALDSGRYTAEAARPAGDSQQQDGAVRVARRAHNAEVAGSKPSSCNQPYSTVQKGDTMSDNGNPAPHFVTNHNGNPRSDSAPTEPLLQFFTFAHLPAPLQYVSEPFANLARDLVARLPRNPERTVALRKLLEAKDCAVRSAVTQ